MGDNLEKIKQKVNELKIKAVDETYSIDSLLASAGTSKYKAYSEVLEFIEGLQKDEEIIADSTKINDAVDGYTWSHDAITIDKETFKRADKETPLENTVSIGISDVIKRAVLFGAALMKKRIIDNAYTWLSNYADDYARYDATLDESYIHDDFYEDFKKAIES